MDKLKLLFFILFLLICAIILCFYNENNSNYNNSKIGSCMTKGSIEDVKTNSRIILANACDILKIPYVITNDGDIIIDGKVKFGFMKNNLNTSHSIKLTNNKYECSNVLRKNNIAVPNYQVFNKIQNEKDIDNIIKKIKINYPLVVKPVCGTKGINVHLNIKNDIQLKKVLKKFINFSNKLVRCDEIIIEEYFEGECYRIICYNDEIIDIIKKEMPYIKGDGISTLGELIEKYNKYRNENSYNNMNVNWEVMNNYNVDSNTVLPIGFRLSIVQNCGCGVANYLQIDPNDFHPSYINMFKNVNKALGLTLSGIDVLIKDIKKPNQAIINEVNSTPSMKSHYYRDSLNSLEKFGERKRDPEVGIKLIKRIFKIE